MKTFIVLSLVLFALFGCALVSMKIGDINSNPANYLGKQVTISGTVTSSIKIGKLSGYTLQDSTGSIGVSSSSLPAVGSNVTISGTIVHDTLFGYYVLTS